MKLKIIFFPQIFLVYLFVMYVFISGCNSTDNGKAPIKASDIKQIPAIRPVSYKSVRIKDHFGDQRLKKTA